MPASEADGWDSVPPSLQPPERPPKWPFVTAASLAAVALAVAIAWPIDMPYYAWSPGPVEDAADVIDVEDGNDAVGDLLFLTVEQKEVNLIEYVAALIDPEVDLVGRERVRAPGVSPEELRRQGLDQMVTSQETAKYVALTKLGYEVTFEGHGARIIQVVPGSAAVGHLDAGDVIVAVDGEPVEFVTEAVELIGSRVPGEVITLTFVAAGDDPSTAEATDVEITLGPFVEVDEEGNVVGQDDDRAMVGVLLENADPQFIFPVDVAIEADNVGGPSAGMMFTLEIMNELSDEDMTKGRRIAGTGTIDPDGVVGAIGGVRQKVFGALAAGAEAVLVPAANYDAALEAADGRIDVVRVETIDDALEYLAGL
jgi:Lon-like protease